MPDPANFSDTKKEEVVSEQSHQSSHADDSSLSTSFFQKKKDRKKLLLVRLEGTTVENNKKLNFKGLTVAPITDRFSKLKIKVIFYRKKLFLFD